jgi:RimJ/RimL family protein N-acetyltransferase
MHELPDFRLFRAKEEDLPFVMATERLEGYGELVGRWDEPRHRSALADRRYAYFIARAAEEPVGFAIVRDWASPERVSLIQRIAVCHPNRGHGRALLRALIAVVFGETDTHRLCLGLFPENVRARRAYEAAGFVAEGVARGSTFFHGQARDELIMSILRPEWVEQTSRKSEP